MQDKERVIHRLPPLSNKVYDVGGGGGGGEVEWLFGAKVTFFLSLKAEQINGRILPSVLWDKIYYAVVKVSSILQNILTSPLNWLLPSSQFPHSKQHLYRLTNNAILHVPSCFLCHPLVPLTSSLTHTASLLHIPSESDNSLGKLKYKLSSRLTNIASLFTYNTAYSARNQHLIMQR